LSTAKSKDRKELIKNAITKLDNSNEDRFDFDSPLTMHALNPATHASLFATSHSIPNLELAVSTNTAGFRQQIMRPMSARRRPSTPSLLDAIPEVYPK